MAAIVIYPCPHFPLSCLHTKSAHEYRRAGCFVVANGDVATNSTGGDLRFVLLPLTTIMYVTLSNSLARLLGVAHGSIRWFFPFLLFNSSSVIVQLCAAGLSGFAYPRQYGPRIVRYEKCDKAS